IISHLTEPRSIGNLKATLGAIVLNTVLSTTALKQSSQPQKLPRNFAQEFFKTQAAKTESMWYVPLYHESIPCSCDVFKRTSTKMAGTLWLAFNNHRLRRCLTHRLRFHHNNSTSRRNPGYRFMASMVLRSLAASIPSGTFKPFNLQLESPSTHLNVLIIY